MEDLLFEDPASSIVKARLFAEEIINTVIKIDEEIELPPYISSLYEKVMFLGKEGVLTSDIQRLFDTVRMTGNKAAHNGEFNDIAEAFKLHRVIYDIAVWFYEVYSTPTTQMRIPSYETPKPPKNNTEEMDKIVKEKILELLGEGDLLSLVKNNVYQTSDEANEEELEETTEILKRDLPQGQSYLQRELSRLRDSAQEAIENANTFSQFKKYLHVERKIQRDIEEILTKNKNHNSGNLVLLCGSVGDGKSHLLAYLKENKPELLEEYEIFNDATESFSPNKNAMETLEEILRDFSDQNIDSASKKVILAINMGVLHNFITREHSDFTFEGLNNFIKNSHLFSQSITTTYSEEQFDLISFGDYHPFELTENGPKSHFFSTVLHKVFGSYEENPFYLAYKADLENGIRSMVHENYEFMQNEYIQNQIVDLTIQVLIKYKLVISARSFLNFIADLLIPDNLKKYNVLTDFERIESSVPNLLFNRRERSFILKAMNDLDPVHIRSSLIDNLIIKLNSLSDIKSIIEENVRSEKSKKWLDIFLNNPDLSEYSINWLSETIIRLSYLTNSSFADKIYDQVYKGFVKNLYYFNSGEKRAIKDYYDQIKDSLFKWKGMPIKNYIYINNPNGKYRLAQSLNLKPTIDHLSFINSNVLESFKANITLAYHDGNPKNTIYLEIDFPLYHLLLRVQEGYCPNRKDYEDAIKFVEFVDKVMKFGNKTNEMLIHFPNDARFYKLKRDDFGAFVFEKE